MMEGTERKSITVHDQVFLDRRKLLVELLFGQAAMLDRSLVFLASGAIGLSILYLGALKTTPSFMHLVFGTWAFCGISLIATLISFHFSQKSIEQEIVYRDELTLGDKSHAKEPTKWPALVTDVLNWVSLGTFVLGVTLLALFAWCNLPT